MLNDQPVLTRALSPRQLLAVDLVAAVAYTLVLLTVALGSAAPERVRVPATAAAAIVLAMGAPLAVRRLWPVPVFLMVLGASGIGAALDIVHDGFVGAGFALYVVAIGERAIAPRPTIGVAAIAVIGLTVLVVAGGSPPLVGDAGPLIVAIVDLAGSWTIGRAVRERRRFAQRSATQLAERAVAEERLRIARDLHDIVAHGLSIIVVKAATANHVAVSRPDEARNALAIIESTGRSALAEMRRMLDVLRGGDLALETPDLAPVPGLSQLPEFVERVAAAGVRVDLSLSGAEDLPEGVALSVHRIVQEALTNVVKHAAPAHCRVAVFTADDTVLVEVEDDGERTSLSDPFGGEGRGLIGMRERVRALGGEFSAGPAEHGGFRVVARIPYRVASTPVSASLE